MHLLFCLLLASAASGQKVEYVGGTIPNLEKSAAWIDLARDTDLALETRAGRFEVPFSSINTIEYGQKVNRRYVAAVVISPLLLLSKKRQHFLTLGYTDEAGRQQAVVLRVGKGEIRALLVSLEAKTGRKVEYQDAEARKAGKG